jgi:hypothetical protein
MSTILVDNLTGKTSAGDITVTSEGGAATQSLQQGLAKCWVNFNGTGTIAIRDSLSVSGLVDDATSDYTVNLSNAMANSNFAIVDSSCYDSEVGGGGATGATESLPASTTSYALHSGRSTSGSEFDNQYVYGTIFGDLA